MISALHVYASGRIFLCTRYQSTSISNVIPPQSPLSKYFQIRSDILKGKFNVPWKVTVKIKKINSSFKFNYTILIQYLIKLKLFKIIKISQFSFKEIIINCHQLIEILLIWIFFLKSTEFMWKKYNPFILTSIFSVLPSSTLSLLKFIKYPCK